MGLFSRIFRKKEEVKSYTLEELEQELKKRHAQARQEVEEELIGYVAELKHIYKHIAEAVEEIEKAPIPEKAHERAKKIASASKEKLVIQLRSMLKKLEPTSTPSLEGLSSYCKECRLAVTKTGITSGRSLIITGVFLEKEMSQLAKYLKEFMSVINHIEEELERNADVIHDPLLKQIREMKGLLDELEKHKKELEHKRNELADLEQELAGLKEKERVLLRSKRWKKAQEIVKELEGLKAEKNMLEAQIQELFVPLSRAFRKYEKLVETGKLDSNGEHVKVLRTLTSDPLTVIDASPKAETVKEVVIAVKNACIKKLLEKNEKKAKATIAACDAVLEFDFFTNYFWKKNEIQRKINDLSDTEALAVYKEMETLKAELKLVEQQVQKMSKEVKLWESELETLSGQAKQKLALIESGTAERFSTQVKLTLGVEEVVKE
jgi:polyhydroxyalkanoate synthesis regulator phasin